MEAKQLYAVVCMVDSADLHKGNAKDHLNFAFFIQAVLPPPTSLPLPGTQPNAEARGQLLVFKQGEASPFRIFDDVAPFALKAEDFEHMAGIGHPRLIYQMKRNMEHIDYTDRIHKILADFTRQEGTHGFSSKKWFTEAIRLLKKENVLAHFPDQPKTDVLVHFLEDRATADAVEGRVLGKVDVPETTLGKVQASCEIL